MSTQLVGNVHLIAGDAERIAQVLELLEGEGMDVQGNPDIYVRQHQSFGIEDARELRERAALRALGSRRVFITVAPSMTNEAQNALLKTLEEPPADALFFFVVSSPEVLLPTLRSRAQMLTLSGGKNGAGLVDAKKFLAASSATRLEMLKPLLEKDDDEKRDVGAIIGFLASLERALAKNVAGLESVYRARKYMGDKGALVKPLLEQVALLVPKM